jgi:hypothetical protein
MVERLVAMNSQTAAIRRPAVIRQAHPSPSGPERIGRLAVIRQTIPFAATTRLHGEQRVVVVGTWSTSASGLLSSGGARAHVRRPPWNRLTARPARLPANRLVRALP